MLVGITGKAGSGKDTVGDYLVTQFDFARTSFAAPIKRMLNVLLDVPMSQWDDREWKETVIPAIGVSPRHMAQTLGTEWGRTSIGENFWADATLNAVAKEGYDKVVVTDARFDNEARRIKELGGIVVSVYRNSDQTQLLTHDHASEAGVTPVLIDYALLNNSTFDDLYNQVDKFIEWNRRRLVA